VPADGERGFFFVEEGVRMADEHEKSEWPGLTGEEEPTEANTPLGDPVDDVSEDEHRRLNLRGAAASLLDQMDESERKAFLSEYRKGR
jgi:hypothetical protein